MIDLAGIIALVAPVALLLVLGVASRVLWRRSPAAESHSAHAIADETVTLPAADPVEEMASSAERRVA